MHGGTLALSWFAIGPLPSKRHFMQRVQSIASDC